MKKIVEDYKVSKSNNLINAIYSLSLTKQRVILILISLINPVKDRDISVFKLKTKDIINILNLKGKSAYHELQKLTLSIVKDGFEIIKPDGKPIQFSWFASCEYKGKYIEFEISRKLKPYLLDLSEKYTSYRLKNILPLKSPYYIRLYELLREYAWRRKKERYFDIAELKAKLGVPDSKYKQYGHFKARVLSPAQKQISQKTDLEVDFKPKLGPRKKVLGVLFFISTKKVIDMIEVDGKAVPEKELINSMKSTELYLELINYYCLTENQAKVILSNKDESELRENLEYIAGKIKSGNVNDIGAYSWKIIKDNIKIQRSLFEVEKETKEAELRKKQAEKQKQERLELGYREYEREQVKKYLSSLPEKEYEKIKTEAATKVKKEKKSRVGFKTFVRLEMEQVAKRNADILSFEDWKKREK